MCVCECLCVCVSVQVCVLNLSVCVYVLLTFLCLCVFTCQRACVCAIGTVHAYMHTQVSEHVCICTAGACAKRVNLCV